jgi:hypothetical protein
MIAALAKAYPTVLCRWCRKPIRVPKKIENRHDDHDDVEGTAEELRDLVSLTFILRCRACEKESVYSVNQIDDHTPESE